VGANLPDVDILAVLAGPLADLEWRRGWTHGILALLVLPLLLTLSIGLLQRLRPRRAGTIPFRQDQLLLLATIAVVSHPLLDTLNTYGVRWLMPFSGRWFYGDALFIIDPWAWITLGAGVWWSWRRWRKAAEVDTRPAQWAITVFGLYAGGMWASSEAARSIISTDLEMRSALPVRTAMAGPLPLTIFSRGFVAVRGDEYLVGTFRWLPPSGVIHDEVQRFSRARPPHPAMEAALARQELRRFLGWARFPTFSIETTGRREYLVHGVDLRYALRPGARFGSITVPVTLSSQDGD
jgi:inner membrane protein